MSQQSKTVVKTYFETGDIPTESQFVDLIDSYFDNSSGQTLTTLISSNSATWNNTSTVVQTNSATWDSVSTVVQNGSATWDNTSTVVQTNSANWDISFNKLSAISDISTFTGDVTATGTYLTLTISGSAIALPVYRFTL